MEMMLGENRTMAVVLSAFPFVQNPLSTQYLVLSIRARWEVKAFKVTSLQYQGDSMNTILKSSVVHKADMFLRRKGENVDG